jgi:hypothetical protein
VLDPPTALQILATLREAHTGESPRTATQPSAAAAPAVEHEAPAADGSAAEIDPQRAAATGQPAKVRLRVLGVPQIEDVTRPGRSLRAKALEIAVFLAGHPDGATTGDSTWASSRPRCTTRLSPSTVGSPPTPDNRPRIDAPHPKPRPRPPPNRLLSVYFPASTDALSADYQASLARIPNGVSKVRGIRVGESAAWAIQRLREGDGRDADITLNIPPGPGVWRPTPPAFAPMLAPWLGFVRPLLLASPTQLRLAGPDRLTSAAYARDFNEVKAVGAAASTTHTPTQTDTARFWSDNLAVQYQAAFRDLATRHTLCCPGSSRTMTSSVRKTTRFRRWPARCGRTALVAVGLVQPHSRDLSTATSGNSSGEP